MIGVFSAAWLEPMAQVLRNLGSERVWITHGADGLDEMTTTGPTKIVELRNGAIHAFEITPEELGLTRAEPRRSKAATPPTTPTALIGVLEGAARTPIATSPLLRRRRALVVAGKARDLAREASARAAAAIRFGRGAPTLAKLVAVSNA